VLSKHLRRNAWANFTRAHTHRRQSWRMKAILTLNISIGCPKQIIET